MANDAQKVAIVTGGSQGIGAGLVTAYRERGYAVVAVAKSMNPSDDPEVLTISGDLAEPITAAKVVGAALNAFGRVDTLVNNAGIFISKPFTDYTAEDYAAVVGVNLTGFFTITQLAIGQMADQGSGHVVNVSAVLADHPVAGVPSVLISLTKGGMESATKSLAIEYATTGVRVNAVSLGIIATPMHPVLTDPARAELPPVGHMGQVGDVVGGVMYLESAPFVTGAILPIDGGRTAGH